MFTKILKFGGSSVGTPKMIKKVGEIVYANALANRHMRMAVVVSAFQGVTDQLLKCARLAAKNSKQLSDELKNLKERHLKAVKLLVRGKKLKVEGLNYVENLFQELNLVLEKISKEKQVSNKNLDWVASFGERLSAYIVAAHLCQASGVGCRAYYVDARELVKTNNNFVNAAVDFLKTNRRIQNYFTKKQRNKETRKAIPVITGFLGSTAKGETTTLGRGGSDYSAAIFGAALGARPVRNRARANAPGGPMGRTISNGVKVIEIWTDVDGVMSADPRLVKRALTLPKISYEEAIEMAYFGAKVIHPATMLPAIKKGIPILIKNTFNPSAPGTLISKGGSTSIGLSAKTVTSIDEVVLINVAGVSLAGVPGSAARVFKATAKAKANVILISQASSEHTICFAIKSAELSAALKTLQKEFAREIKSGQVAISTIPAQTIVALVGDGMRGVPGIAGKLFKTLGDNGVNVSAIAQGGSERNISFVVDSVNKIKALNAAHDEFFLGGPKNIFLIGAGNIGGTLLDQIFSIIGGQTSQGRFDLPKLRVCGIIDVFNMLMDERGIGLKNWRQKLKKAEKPDLNKWLNWAKSLPLGNKTLVDCTASNGIASRYIEMAEAGFHIVTPNKKFNVRSMKEYKKLRAVMAKNKKQFFYETNVGAALPVIQPLRDLLKTGDKILKIEGIFSGTLSYIFNAYDGAKPFNKVVAEAKELGYTEPDPREDLSGQDVGRKLLVLAREIGLEMEFKDVEIENLVPAALQRGVTPGEFLKVLSHYNADFKKLLERAYKQNKVLRYVARLEKGKAVASLQAVPADSPLAATRGADNIFAIYTKRYNKRPLVVQGPGAGREVTAAGVLADILKI